MTEKKGIAVFLDRDGTVNVDFGFVGDPKNVKLLPGAGKAIHKLNAAGIPVIIISNQSAVGRGYYSRKDVKAVNAEVKAQLEALGASVHAFYFCPHLPEAGCECRKPRLGMLKQAEREWDVDLAKSFVVGDKPADVELGKNAGGKGILVLTGQAKQEEIASWAVQPDYVARDLLEAVNWILKRT